MQILITDALGQFERWLPIRGTEGNYEVSDMGRVRSRPRPRTRGGILKALPRKDGYLTVCICRDGRFVTVTVHRLVATAFLAGSGEHVRHLNGVPADNRAVNLAWGTAVENERDKVEQGRTPSPRTHCPAGHGYDESTTRDHRGYRRCGECWRRLPAKKFTPEQLARKAAQKRARRAVALRALAGEVAT